MGITVNLLTLGVAVSIADPLPSSQTKTTTIVSCDINVFSLQLVSQRAYLGQSGSYTIALVLFIPAFHCNMHFML